MEYNCTFYFTTNKNMNAQASHINFFENLIGLHILWNIVFGNKQFHFNQSLGKKV